MKVLCLDGGGIRGVYALAILESIEKEFNRPISHHFDLLAGTSTGSIIAAAAAIQNDMGTVLEMYREYGKRIFNRQSKIGLLGSVYSDRYLRKLLKKAFGDLNLADVPKPLLIPAVDLTHGRPFVHRSNVPGDGEDIPVKLWDAVLSSCSAPVYFPPNNVENKYLSIDGGLWANNPSLVCLSEGIHYFRENLESISILSLGTGLQKVDFSYPAEKNWGIGRWLPIRWPSLKVEPKLLDLALDISSESVSYHCSLLLGKQYFRINRELGQEMPFDEIAYTETLIQLGKETFAEQKSDIAAFLQI
jgi:uncharacterized protein